MPFFIPCLWGLLSGEAVTSTTRLPAKSQAPPHRLKGKLCREASKLPVEPLLCESVFIQGSGVLSGHPSGGPQSGTWATGSARTFLVSQANRQGPRIADGEAKPQGCAHLQPQNPQSALDTFRSPRFRPQVSVRRTGSHDKLSQRLLPAHTPSDSEEDSLWGFTSRALSFASPTLARPSVLVEGKTGVACTGVGPRHVGAQLLAIAIATLINVWKQKRKQGETFLLGHRGHHQHRYGKRP